MHGGILDATSSKAPAESAGGATAMRCESWQRTRAGSTSGERGPDVPTAPSAALYLQQLLTCLKWTGRRLTRGTDENARAQARAACSHHASRGCRQRTQNLPPRRQRTAFAGATMLTMPFLQAGGDDLDHATPDHRMTAKTLPVPVPIHGTGTRTFGYPIRQELS